MERVVFYGEPKPSVHEHTAHPLHWCGKVYDVIKPLEYVCTRLKGHDGCHEAASVGGGDSKHLVMCEWEE